MALVLVLSLGDVIFVYHVLLQSICLNETRFIARATCTFKSLDISKLLMAKMHQVVDLQLEIKPVNNFLRRIFSDLYVLLNRKFSTI